MNNIIYNYELVKLNKLIFGKEQIYENNTYIPIFVKDTNKKINNFNIKTCKLHISNKLIPKSKHFVSLRLTIFDGNKDINTFTKFILRLEKYIKKKYKTQFKNKKYISILKENKIYINLNINNNNFIDINYNKIDKLEIDTPTNGYFVITIKNIWFNEDKWGINLYLYSALILPSQGNILNELKVNEIKDIFKEEIKENKNEEMLKNDSQYAKYFKLKAMKVPLMAIKNKMMLNNLDISIIDYNGNTLTKDVLKKNNTKVNITINRKDLLNNKHTLKKTPIIDNKKIIETQNLKIPSLEEILNQIKKMKKK